MKYLTLILLICGCAEFKEWEMPDDPIRNCRIECMEAFRYNHVLSEDDIRLCDRCEQMQRPDSGNSLLIITE
jgi:hypothetical protein